MEIWMNELIFLGHVLVVLFFVFYAFKMGKYALASLIAIQAVLANLFVLKQIELFHFVVTASDVFAIGSIVCANLLQEFFGKEILKKVISVTSFILLFFVAMSIFQLAYIPATSDVSSIHFHMILNRMPRLLIASFVTFFIVQRMDAKFFGYLQLKFSKLSLKRRVGISLVFSQFIDTLLFSYLGLYGEYEKIWHVIVFSYIVKLSISLLMLIIWSLVPETIFKKRLET
ncbi:MAG TPA: queuosine precursor transporter [Chlamydiales bacterium]|nr:queuosine precursor transporter [Chlamydiales bacterium]